jgi:hypothetical protein
MLAVMDQQIQVAAAVVGAQPLRAIIAAALAVQV